jgi:hypothetical protein
MMQGMMHGDITGMMLGMGLIGLIQLVVIILGIAALVKYLSFDLFRRQRRTVRSGQILMPPVIELMKGVAVGRALKRSIPPAYGSL